MNLPDLSIRNPVFAWMLMAFLIVFGGICWWQMGISQMPDVDFPTVQVTVEFEGAAPEIIETDVIDPIEDAVMSVQGVREITATARHGRASLNIEFELDRDIDVAVQEVQTKIGQAERLLPREIERPVVQKSNADDQTIMWVALSGHVPYQDLVTYARYHLRDKLQTVPGVGDILLGGYRDRNMRVWLKLDEMKARDLAVDDVIGALRQEHVEIPAGRIESAAREMNVRSLGEAPTVAEFKQIVVAYRNGAPVHLEDIAVIEDGMADRRRLGRNLGVPALGLGIKKQYGSNAVQVGRGVRAKVAELAKHVPEGMILEVNSDTTIFVEESIHEIQFTLVLSVALTSIVCWLFLGSFSSTFNILLAIPTSIVGSFIVIYFLGFTLNTFTLLALSLAVGIVVDDAIMVLENIVRHREKGDSRVAAASRGAREISMAAFAATLAIIAIFLPIAFVHGLIGKFLYQFGVTLSVAVALSLIEALTLTPMRCSQMLAVGRATAVGRLLDRFYHGLAAAYRRTLGGALRFHWLVLALSLLVFTGSFVFPRGLETTVAGQRVSIAPLRAELVPPQDQSMLLVRLQTPVGSSVDYTDEKMQECEKYLSTHGAVLRYFAMIGGFGGGEVDTGIIFMTLKPRDERPDRRTQQGLMDEIRGRFNSIPGLKAYVSDMSMRAFTGRGTTFPIEFAITGDDWPVLAQSSERIMEKMRESGLLVDVHSDYLMNMPEVKVVPDRRRAADLGVSAQSIGDTLNAMVGGVRVAKFQEGGHRYDVRVRLLSDQRSRPEDIHKLSLRNREGRLVRLTDVIQTFETSSLQTITRRNRSRAITIRGNIAPGASQQAANERIAAIADELLPPGYELAVTGSSRLFEEGKWAFLAAIGLGGIVAYMVLASQFNSFVHPLLVLLAMPFSLSGAFAAMWLADVSLNMYSMIGIVLLMGIVKKNSILLVDFTNQLRERKAGEMALRFGLKRLLLALVRWDRRELADYLRQRRARHGIVHEALLEACPIRLRPILMTSISTIAAALPPALALGPGSESRIPMAVTVIGGMIASTALTLIVVPCAYSIMPGRVRHAEEKDAPVPARVGAPETALPE